MSDTPNYPPRKRRAESFFGLHFDFHAGPDCTEVGKLVTPEMIDNIINLVQPDYLQCDCKGHRGYSSYPTKAGVPAPGFVKDQLRIWREATAARGVALYMHFSGVQDLEMVKRHPSWAQVSSKGKRHKANTSVFGPYVDKSLIPQFKELSSDYGVDGVWVDGEVWAAGVDYNKKALQRFTEKTGITDIPRKPGDAHWHEFREFCRQGFRNYLRHYVDVLHRHDPNFQIASNWTFSSLSPEPVCADVDFISGDFTPQDSVNSARFQGRCIATQGKPWDLMAWGFSGKWTPDDSDWTAKEAVQLKQEAASVMSLGGGFQVYHQQRRDGSVRDSILPSLAEVGKFCRARQPFCQYAQAVPQIGLLYSTAAVYRMCQELFVFADENLPLQGMLHALLESQYAVEIVSEHHLAGDKLAQYPLIIIPEWDYLEEDFRQHLLTYVRNGGKLLVIGPQAVALFDKELDITLEGEAAFHHKWLEFNGPLAAEKGLVQNAQLGATARPFGKLHDTNDEISPSQVASVITPLGQGQIAAVLMNMGISYLRNRTVVAREFIRTLVRELFPTPMVEVQGSPFVDVTINRVNDKLAINLVNTAGPHHDKDVITYDAIPPIGPLEVTIRRPQAPQKVTLQPAGTELPYQYANGVIAVTIPQVEIHEIILVE
jgi:hypothetical protein